jgi:hypothetical protein
MTMLPLPWNDIEAWLEASDAAEIAADIRAYAEQAAERERCAKLADEYATYGGSNFAAWFTKLAAAIRA